MKQMVQRSLGVVALAAGITCGANFITNGDFEMGKDGWHPLDSTTILDVETQGNPIENQLLKVTPSNGAAIFYQQIYEAASAIRNSSSENIFNSKISLYSEEATEADIMVKCEHYDGTDSYHALSKTFIPAGDTLHINKNFNISRIDNIKRALWGVVLSNTNSSPVFVDNVSMEAVDQAYVKASGQNLTLNGYQVQMKGISFSNFYNYSNWYPEDTTFNLLEFKHHKEEDILFVKEELTQNVIRFGFSGNWFSDNVEENKHNVWTWFDRNIAWAKKHGVFLILDMHVPVGLDWLDATNNQGVPANSPKWIWNDTVKQEKHLNIWREISKRYGHESIIAGYGMLNEPIVPDTGDAWIGTSNSLAERTITAIRENDKNHLLIVDALAGVEMGYGMGKVKPQKLVQGVYDNNLMYDFHFYAPALYTHQGAPWTDLGDVDGYYPDSTMVEFYKELDWKNDFAASTDDSFSVGTEWEEFTTSWINHEYTTTKVGQPYFLIDQPLAKGDTVYFDNLIVESYNKWDSTGIDTTKFEAITWKTAPAFYHFGPEGSADSNFIYFTDTTVNNGVNDQGALAIAGPTGTGIHAFDAQHNWFFNNTSRKYRIKGYMKKSSNSVPNPKMKIVLWKDRFGSAMPRTKAFIKRCIGDWIYFKESKNVPLSILEFGVMDKCFETDSTGINRGAEEWIQDVIDICKEEGINWSYWVFHGKYMGVFQNLMEEWPNLDNLNIPLKELLERN